jgi:hypothetical protein
MLRYDAPDLRRQLGAYVSTPNGNGGSFWQSGRGPAADQDGNIYAVTGNGDYDGIHKLRRELREAVLSSESEVGAATGPTRRTSGTLRVCAVPRP